MTPQQSSARAFGRRITAIRIGIATATGLMILAYLVALLDLSERQWAVLMWAMAGYAALCVIPSHLLQARALAPILHYLRLHAERKLKADELRKAFAALADLPQRVAMLSGAAWIPSGVVISTVMAFAAGDWGVGRFGVLAVAGLAGAFVSALLSVLVLKRATEGERQECAAEIRDPEERRQANRQLSLASKLLTAVIGVTVTAVLFALLLAHSRATHYMEEFATRWQARLLNAMAAELREGDLRSAHQAVIPDATELPVSVFFHLVDADGKISSSEASRARSAPRRLGADVIAAVRRQADAGLQHGSGVAGDTDQAFYWRSLAHGSWLVATTPRSQIHPRLGGMIAAFAALLLVSACLSGLVAYALASDVSRATRALSGEADRLASGDLTRGRVLESEDELGELARTFDRMRASLRATVGRVAEAADRVETTAGEMSAVSERIATVTTEQVRGIQQTSESIERINLEIQGIADASEALNTSVEESSSSILELGAAGGQLNDTASVLSRRVAEVSTSIEAMVRSVGQVSSNTEQLSRAAEETSASIQEMASAMRQVDTNAGETSRLSRQVVASAETGHATVRQTMAGMEAIRDATETAQSVIRDLGSRATEIGAVVRVIDDVADETGLLALNAAIIAAQAGEQGRAFSVVADEIKDLADRVLSSTKEIGALVRGVQEETANAISAIERGSESVASGVDQSLEAGRSLEEITRASRESGSRIDEIVAAVQEQTKAASHVAELMERVRVEVEQIRSAVAEQERGHEVMARGATAMREVAQQVRGTTEEQARGSSRISSGVENVRAAVNRINGSLQEQTQAFRAAVEFLDSVHGRTGTHEEAAQQVGSATRELLRQAESLRDEVRRFRV